MKSSILPRSSPSRLRTSFPIRVDADSVLRTGAAAIIRTPPMHRPCHSDLGPEEGCDLLDQSLSIAGALAAERPSCRGQGTAAPLGAGPSQAGAFGGSGSSFHGTLQP